MTLPKSPCPGCGYLCDSATEVGGDGEPEPGHYSVCINCGAFSVFAPDMTLRVPTWQERAELPEEAIFAQFAIRHRGRLPTR